MTEIAANGGGIRRAAIAQAPLGEVRAPVSGGEARVAKPPQLGLIARLAPRVEPRVKLASISPEIEARIAFLRAEIASQPKTELSKSSTVLAQITDTTPKFSRADIQVGKQALLDLSLFKQDDEQDDPWYIMFIKFLGKLFGGMIRNAFELSQDASEDRMLQNAIHQQLVGGYTTSLV